MKTVKETSGQHEAYKNLKDGGPKKRGQRKGQRI